ncbi:MAG: hypothetical protein JOZ62_17410 [Acidobacteriaceae bacterium]|nr:hypothetical protein [Acidobacteriaceae bacterium]
MAVYYEKEGAGHSLRIVIPQGQYAPQFLSLAAEEGVLGQPSDAISVSSPPQPAELPQSLEYAPELLDEAVGRTPEPLGDAPKSLHATVGIAKSSRRWIIITALAVLVIAAALAFVFRWSKISPSLSPSGRTSPLAAIPGTDSIRILSGLRTGTYTDGFGRIWQHDNYFDGGAVVDLPGKTILGTREPRLFQSRRQGQFRYDIPTAPGDYEVRLYFAETHYGETNTAGYGGEASRAFSIQLNGTTVKHRLDVVGEAGVSTADIKVYRDITPASDGRIHLSFAPLVGVPFINAIEITPGTLGQLKPIRIVAQPRGYTDARGIYWQPDLYATGGVMVARTEAPDAATDPRLWAGERFGNLTYTFPVPPGSYTANLYMTERWFGRGLPGGGGAGSRFFDILCNGVAIERDFDLFKRAGGPNRAFVYAMRGLKANHQDKLVISLVPSKNFPLVNAIEILDEGRPRMNTGVNAIGEVP